MRKILVVVAGLFIAGAAGAATLVLKGGKQVDVTKFEQRGNYLIVQYPDGHLLSYPLAAVDMAATKAANATPGEAAPAPAKPTGPHSPFFQAQSSVGSAAMTITDADVQHLTPDDESGDAADQAGETKSGAGVVALLGYDKKQLEDGQWEITATVANQGKAPVQGINASIHLLDENGKEVGAGTGSYSASLAPGQQATIVARIFADGAPNQVAFDFQWQQLTLKPKEEGAESPTPPAPQPPAGATPNPEMQRPQGWQTAPGAGPMGQVANPMAIPPLTTPPTTNAPQTPPQPAPEKPKA